MKITPDITKAVSILRAGGLVAFPTETVYGLGADAANATAVDSIFRVKERPSQHPLIVHISSTEQLGDWAINISPQAWQLARAFWPGPLTLVLKKHPGVLENVTGGQETVGIRIPKHAIAQNLLSAFGGGIAAPSANKFTHISPTHAEAVKEELGGQVALILDGGDSEIGLESTIIDMSSDAPRLLRPGMISRFAIEEVLDTPIVGMGSNAKVRAPGMHALHYAPRTKTSVIEMSQLPHYINTLSREDLPCVVLTHSNLRVAAHKGIDVISLPNNPVAFARDLYRTLRAVDKKGYREIMIEKVPSKREWEAINDRLAKASGQK